MAKKSQPIYHSGKKSWWDGSVKTTCGQRVPADQARKKRSSEPGQLCAACAAGRQHKH